ncbi:hypothetical protein OG21DRAFT_1423539 [Imleria badia]|nr:hypothetical protein OG21DRAFT_1423539 [Imleria badia]
MLAYALKHRQAVDSVTQDCVLGLRSFELDNKEWNLLEQLHNVLKDATLYFLCGTPNLAAVIPAMDLMDEKLTTFSLNCKYSPTIRAAISLAKRTLNRYYQLTDSSEVYRIAMVLHPRRKLNYFKNAKWEESWINTAKQLVKDAFEHSYLTMETDDHDNISEGGLKNVCYWLFTMVYTSANTCVYSGQYL